MFVVNNFIDGKFEPTQEYLDNVDPATGQVYSKVASSTCKDVWTAVAVAQRAQPLWQRKTVSERAAVLRRVADLLEERLEEFAVAESRDQGKPVWLAQDVDIPRAIHNFRHFADNAVNDRELAVPQPRSQLLHYVCRSPVGVVGIITPWNLPLYLLSFKLAPALVYGNAVVAKPSELTSVTTFMLAKLFLEAGLPNGVCNFVFGLGDPVGEALCSHPEIRAISFTGSTRTGTRISEIAAPLAKKCSLEMGGKNAAIVFPDCDRAKCLRTLLRACFLNQGEICLCTSRVFVHESIYKEFLADFVEETKALKVGPPTERDSFLGALISKEHFEKVRGYIKLAHEEGGTVLTGGLHPVPGLDDQHSLGYYVLPTVIEGLPASSRCMQEEIFGPVVCFCSFSDEEEVLDLVNGVQYGLCASVWTIDVRRLHRIVNYIDVGTIWANCWLVRHLHLPFGGTKMSGLGREGTEPSREFYTECKTVCVDFSL
ncbi:aldehyde dehydrogenase family 8 member A1-like [Varroa jacobsoni]|uniref:aldehyde dehydrogenase family 8 member A1-like n=1 Tax=Varroa jacobsoni TaxID=62625 RepID=UPI000BF603B8|nr:aldehyde dehydrogenase family 8 member A1-like [Varroa jacobsoni]XP_022708795.1 aldehyde dehydrogenase family 8 member A1-like [Varroa jacobsoni]